jgi:hypothetical protein
VIETQSRSRERRFPYAPRWSLLGNLPWRDPSCRNISLIWRGLQPRRDERDLEKIYSVCATVVAS